MGKRKEFTGLENMIVAVGLPRALNPKTPLEAVSIPWPLLAGRDGPHRGRTEQGWGQWLRNSPGVPGMPQPHPQPHLPVLQGTQRRPGKRKCSWLGEILSSTLLTRLFSFLYSFFTFASVVHPFLLPSLALAIAAPARLSSLPPPELELPLPPES